jgi:hypothetical protein
MTRKPSIIFFVLLAAIFVAYSVPPMDVMTESHDGLDSVTTYFLMINQFDVGFFDMSKILPQFLGGVLPFNALAISDAHIVYAVFKLLPPFEGFIVVSALFKTLAFVGMYLFLTAHVLPESRHQRLIASATAFCFAVFPTTFVYLGSSLALPLFAWGVLNTLKGDRRWQNWLAILIYPLVATLHLGGVFVYAAVGGWALILLMRKHPSSRYFAAQIATLAVVSVIVERRLLYHWFFASYDYVSSRTILYDGPLAGEHSLTLARWFRETVGRVLLGSGAQFPDFHAPFPILMVLAAIVGFAVFRSLRTDASGVVGRRLLWVVAGISTLGALAIAEENYVLLAQIADFPFRLHRIEVVTPMLWWSAFALALFLLTDRPGRWVRGSAIVLAAIVCLHTAIQFPGLKEGVMQAAGIPRHLGLRQGLLTPNAEPRPVWNEHGGNFSFSEYFELEAFRQLEPALAAVLGADKSAYKVISVHMKPAPAQFNGYYSLDGVFADYEASAHTRFWEMFESESKKLGTHGHRLEFPVAPESRIDGKIDPDFDTCIFWERGGRAVFSRSDFADPDRLDFNRLGKYGRVRVYLVNDPPDC